MRRAPPSADRQQPFGNRGERSVQTLVSPPRVIRYTSPSSLPHSPESVTYRFPASSNAEKFGTRIGRSGVPVEYIETSPSVEIRVTQALPKSHAKTLPLASSVTP